LLNPVPGLDPPRRVDVYDFDDALYLGPDGRNAVLKWTKQEARRCDTCLRRCRLAIAGNPVLADYARRIARRVEVVPSCIDPTKQNMHHHRDVDELIVGWIGSRTTSRYLLPILPAFERLNTQRNRARLVLVGADATVEAPWIEHRRWSTVTEARDLASFDIGIMPLPDDNWARGKCGYKLLQYFAAGVPAIASPVGIAPKLIGKGRGILADGISDWHRALEQLLGDVVERRQRGLAARSFVESEYSYQRWAPVLAGMLRSISP
jgi:glycosyltransferase involved in cell wall biosynthesis